MNPVDALLTELERAALVGLFVWAALILGAVGALVGLVQRRRSRARYVRGVAKAPRTWRGQAAVGRVRLDGETREMPRYDGEPVGGVSRGMR